MAFFKHNTFETTVEGLQSLLSYLCCARYLRVRLHISTKRRQSLKSSGWRNGHQIPHLQKVGYQQQQQTTSYYYANQQRSVDITVNTFCGNSCKCMYTTFCTWVSLLGATLAVTSGLESLAGIFSPLAFLTIYPATLYIFHGFSLVVAAMVYAFSFFLMRYGIIVLYLPVYMIAPYGEL